MAPDHHLQSTYCYSISVASLRVSWLLLIKEYPSIRLTSIRHGTTLSLPSCSACRGPSRCPRSRCSVELEGAFNSKAPSLSALLSERFRTPKKFSNSRPLAERVAISQNAINAILPQLDSSTGEFNGMLHPYLDLYGAADPRGL